MHVHWLNALWHSVLSHQAKTGQVVSVWIQEGESTGSLASVSSHHGFIGLASVLHRFKYGGQQCLADFERRSDHNYGYFLFLLPQEEVLKKCHHWLHHRLRWNHRRINRNSSKRKVLISRQLDFGGPVTSRFSHFQWRRSGVIKMDFQQI